MEEVNFILATKLNLHQIFDFHREGVHWASRQDSKFSELNFLMIQLPEEA
jgi:hypothetical protein